MSLPVKLLLLFIAYAIAVYLLNLGLPWDDAIEHWFFTMPCNESNARDCWVLSKNNPNLNFWLHRMPQTIAQLSCAVAAIILAAGFFCERLRKYRLLCIVWIAGLGATAGIVNLLKYTTGHYCPGQLERFGGVLGEHPAKPPMPDCYPAGHPAGGFGLLALWFAPLSSGWRRFGLWAGIVLGSALSIIQMARGEHFLSHILATILTALLVGMVVRLVIKNAQREENTGFFGRLPIESPAYDRD